MLKTDSSITHVLNRACGCARYAYNWARERWFEKKKAGQESVTCAELRKEFNAEKLDWMYESPKGSMDQAIKNFCQAKKRHYENPKQFGFPKRKKYASKRSFYIENDMRELFKEKMMHKSSAVCMLSGLAEVELIEKIRDAVASGRVVV